MKQYYITKPNGQNLGPLDENFVREQYAAGAYEDGTTVWTDGMSDFAPISTAFSDMNNDSAVALSPSSSSKQYYIATPDGQQQGPLDEQQVREQYIAGKFNDDALVWADGMPDWITISSVFPNDKPKLPPPLPPKVPSAPSPPPVSVSTALGIDPGNISQNAVLNYLVQRLLSWRNIYNYKGRASRKEYWITVLTYAVTLIASAILTGILGIIAEEGQATVLLLIATLLSIAVLLFYAYWIAISISLTCRRLHDLGYSGWWQLIALIPYIGAIGLLIGMCMKGQNGPNKYGPEPKE